MRCASRFPFRPARIQSSQLAPRSWRTAWRGWQLRPSASAYDFSAELFPGRRYPNIISKPLTNPPYIRIAAVRLVRTAASSHCYGARYGQELTLGMFTLGPFFHRLSDAVSFAQSTPQRQEGAERLARAVTGLAGLAAVVIALAFPAAYFLSAYNRSMGV